MPVRSLFFWLLAFLAQGAETNYPFDQTTLSFGGTPLEQARMLLRPVLPYGRLGEPLARLPTPLEDLVGKPIHISSEALLDYLNAHSIPEADLGGPCTNHLAATYFVIHDTSTPNYLGEPFPANINTADWPQNGLQRWSKSPVAHVFVNRLGESVGTHSWVTPWRATKLEVKVLGEKGRGLFVHTELVQPRRTDPQGRSGNDAIAPEPGFTAAQLDRLALLYVVASVQHGSWMIPAFHATVDAGIPDAHDDPQNFDLVSWAKRVANLVEVLDKPRTEVKAALRFEVSIKKGLVTESNAGRLFLVFSRSKDPEPRATLGRTGPDAPITLARDLSAFGPGDTAILDARAFAFPVANLAEIPAGDYFLQAIFDSNPDIRSAGAPGNLYSGVRKFHFSQAKSETVRIELTEQVPPEQLPAETDSVKFIKIQSQLLSRFHGRPIFLRAGILLPRDYENEPNRRYPLWVRIGGFNTRYTSVNRLLMPGSEFRKTWLGNDTPRMIALQLDGDGPLGDPYHVNSANNGPYGDALVQELIPAVEARFRAIGHPQARVLSGTSTGGWVCLALQVFYPEFFNGAWSSCPDPLDFRAFELVDIYQDDNAYVNRHGHERPSERDLKGDVVLTMRREVGVENLLGRGNSYCLSGQQWGAWNAVFGPRGADGLPVPLWNPETGKIDHSVAEQWRKYDLRQVLADNWPTIGPKLQGKIHIASGEADQYFLNNGVHLFDQSLTQARPASEFKITYGSGKGHGWSNLSTLAMLREMQAATAQPMP
jgi:S-formylglutathione hydrolase FrmB